MKITPLNTRFKKLCVQSPMCIMSEVLSYTNSLNINASCGVQVIIRSRINIADPIVSMNEAIPYTDNTISKRVYDLTYMMSFIKPSTNPSCNTISKNSNCNENDIRFLLLNLSIC